MPEFQLDSIRQHEFFPSILCMNKQKILGCKLQQLSGVHLIIQNLFAKVKITMKHLSGASTCAIYKHLIKRGRKKKLWKSLHEKKII